jgi:hypothetical protein
MNKRLLAIVSIVSVSLLIPSVPVNAAIKAGGACPKVGMKSVASGKTFTCVKSGKKLSWNKGVAKSKKPSQSELIAKIAFDEIQKLNATRSRISLKYETGKTFSPSFLNLITQLTDTSAKKFEAFVDGDFPVTIYVYSELDLDIIRKNLILSGQQDTFTYLDYYAKDKNTKNNSIGIAGHTYRASCKSNQTECVPAMNAAGAGYPSYSSTANQNKGNLTTVPHELFHVIQDVYMYENLGSSYFPEEEKWKASQTIFREGAATFMQCAASFSTMADYDECLNEKRDWLRNDAPKYRDVKNGEDLARYLTELETTRPSAPHYILGALFTEWLISKHGIDKFIQLVKQHSIKKEFKVVFASVYDFSLQDAYKSTGDYIYERSKLVVN